ncbi:hypothetical protein ACCT31_39005, partial [Rhizobium ruizarguesonis]
LNSTIDTKSHKISYEWKPEGSRWIDLQANIWRTQTTSSRHQSGGPDLAVTYGDQEYDKWANCFVHNKIPNEFIGRHISEGI